jgi:hypothetical protein
MFLNFGRHNDRAVVGVRIAVKTYECNTTGSGYSLKLITFSNIVIKSLSFCSTNRLLT